MQKQVDGDVLLAASPTLARAVLQWGLLDEYHVTVNPVVAGRGPHFLDGLDAYLTPSLRGLDRLKSGVLVLRHRLNPSTDVA